MVLDPQIRNLLDLFAADPAAKPVQTLAPPEVRERLRKTARAFAGAPVSVGSVQDRTIPGPHADLGVRIYAPPGATDAPLPAIVFFHGGGWVAGDLDSHDPLCRTLCAGSGARLIAVDYRLAPEHRFPAAVVDAVAATEWVAGHPDELGVDPARLPGARASGRGAPRGPRPPPPAAASPPSWPRARARAAAG